MRTGTQANARWQQRSPRDRAILGPPAAGTGCAAALGARLSGLAAGGRDWARRYGAPCRQERAPSGVRRRLLWNEPAGVTQADLSPQNSFLTTVRARSRGTSRSIYFLALIQAFPGTQTRYPRLARPWS